LVRKRVPVTEGELAEAVAEVAGSGFLGTGMRPGDVRRMSKKPDLDEGSGVAGRTGSQRKAPPKRG